MADRRKSLARCQFGCSSSCTTPREDTGSGKTVPRCRSAPMRSSAEKAPESSPRGDVSISEPRRARTRLSQHSTCPVESAQRHSFGLVARINRPDARRQRAHQPAGRGRRPGRLRAPRASNHYPEGNEAPTPRRAARSRYPSSIAPRSRSLPARAPQQPKRAGPSTRAIDPSRDVDV